MATLTSLSEKVPSVRTRTFTLRALHDRRAVVVVAACRLIIAPLFLLAMIACDALKPHDLQIVDRALVSGLPIKSLVQSDTTTALLVYSAATCFSCGTSIPFWRARAQSGRVKFVLVLSTTPSEADLRVLRIQRIPIAGVLAGRRWPSDAVPSEYLVRSGQILARAEGLAEVRQRRLWRKADSLPPPAGAVLSAAAKSKGE